MNTPCTEWAKSRNRAGYGQQWHAGRAHLAHRVAWMTANGPVPDGLLVLHRCDNPPCVNLDHLYLGTQAQNCKDRSDRMRYRDDRGSKHPGAKLTEADVLAIRQRLEAGDGLSFLARAYGVTPQLIYRIKRRLVWRHI